MVGATSTAALDVVGAAAEAAAAEVAAAEVAAAVVATGAGADPTDPAPSLPGAKQFVPTAPAPESSPFPIDFPAYSPP